MTNVYKFRVASNKITLAIHHVLFFKKSLWKAIFISKVNLISRKYTDILLKKEIL